MDEDMHDPFGLEGEHEEGPPDLIGELQEKIYAREDKIKHKDRTVLHPKKYGAAAEWEEELTFKQDPEKIGVSPYAKFFVFSLFFFIVAAGIAAYATLGNRDVISPDKVLVTLSGPVSVKGGESFSFQVSVENKNSVGINMVDITSDFPDGTKNPVNPTVFMDRTVKSIPNIAGKETRTEVVKTALFGTDKERKEIDVSVKFRIEGSDAVYTQKKSFSLTLSSPPLSVVPDLVRDIVSGQDATLKISVKSISPTLIDKTLLRVEYPKGFTFKKATPAPIFGDNLWNIGTLSLGDSKDVIIVGTISGENNQEKVFRIFAGAPGQKDETRIETSFSSLLSATTIKKPFFAAELFVNGSADGNYVLDPTEGVATMIQWRNNLPYKIEQGRVEMSFSGKNINMATLSVRDGGVYNPDSRSMSWDSRGAPALEVIPSGGMSMVGASFELLPFVREGVVVEKNPSLSMSIGVRAKRIGENNVSEDIESFINRTIKIGTRAGFAKSGLHGTGHLKDTGPVPPKAGEETTYTVVWRLSNTTSDISNVKVSAKLPSYVRWTGEMHPSGAPVTYNPVTGEIVWLPGKIKSGTGYQYDKTEVEFQVAFLPSIAQVGSSPDIVSAATMSATDDFSGKKILLSVPSLTTTMTLDSGFDPGVGTVAP